MANRCLPKTPLDPSRGTIITLGTLIDALNVMNTNAKRKREGSGGPVEVADHGLGFRICPCIRFKFCSAGFFHTSCRDLSDGLLHRCFPSAQFCCTNEARGQSRRGGLQSCD